MDWMWQRVSDMGDSLFSYPDPPLSSLLSVWGGGCTLGGKWRCRGGGKREGEGGDESVSTHDFASLCVCFRLPSSSCWGSASCQRAGQAAPLLHTAGRFRPLHATAWEAAAARGMQGLVPPPLYLTPACAVLFLQRSDLAGLPTQMCSSFSFFALNRCCLLLLFPLWWDIKCRCIETGTVTGHRDRPERTIPTGDFLQSVNVKVFWLYIDFFCLYFS